MRKILPLIVLSVIYSLNTNAQNTNAKLIQDKSGKNIGSQIFIETDPTSFFFNGYSLAVRRSSTFIDNLNLGLGIYKVDLPEEFIEQNSTHKGKGWKASTLGFDIFVDYHLCKPNEGLTVGASMSIYNYKISRNNKEENFTSFVPTLRIGYLWRPLKNNLNGLYVYPWVGISTDKQFTGINEIDGEKFEIPKLSFVPSIQIGYSF